MLVLRDNFASGTVDAAILTKAQVATTSFVRTDGSPQSLPPGVRIGN